MQPQQKAVDLCLQLNTKPENIYKSISYISFTMHAFMLYSDTFCCKTVKQTELDCYAV
jgi:hypothetical protein